MRSRAIASALLFLSFSLGSPSYAQNTTSLVVRVAAAPIYAGGTLDVTVSSPLPLKGVVLRTDLSAGRMFLTSPPYVFHVPIATDAALGVHWISAMARASNDQLLVSDAVPATVEPSAGNPAISIALFGRDSRSVFLTYRGEKITPDIVGTFANGETDSLKSSNQLRCQSDTPSVVTVLAPCSLVAVGRGTATVEATFGTLSLPLQVNVTVPAVRGDFDEDGDIDSDDVGLLTAWRNTPAAATGDDRDLNTDKRIDALDLRVLTTLCTRPRCAVQ